MNDWAVLGLDGDPAPGDPGRTRELAGRLRGAAELAEHNTARLRSVAAGGGDLRMQGDYAPKFLEVLGGLPAELAKLGTAYRGAEQALSGFASSLEQAKTQAGTALRQGRDADAQFQGAVRQVQALLPPDRVATVVSGQRLNESLLETAIADLDEGTKVEARAAARRARFAEQDRDRAARLASDAARLRGDAATRCVQGLNTALDGSGIKNKSWFQKAWDTVSAPFRSWDAFVELCGNIAMVVGIAAMFISGPIGWALMATALVAGAVMMGDTLVKFAQGKAGLGDLAFAALGLIPGARGAVSLARLGRGAAGLARGVARGEGVRLVGAGLRAAGGAAARGVRNAATAIPHALTTAGGIRGAITNPRLAARAAHCRFIGRDPVDMASGEMILRQIDFELPGLLPLTVARTHVSSYRAGRWFGPSWNSTLDQRLEIDNTGVYLAHTDGVLLAYPHPRPGQSVLPTEGLRLALTREANGGHTLTDSPTGHTLHFPPADIPDDDTGPVLVPLSAITDRNGHRIDFHYDADGVLTEIHHHGGYWIDVHTHQGRITAFRLRGTANHPDLDIIDYGYDDNGNLTEIINSSGQALRFDYDPEGRMTRWADRNGTEYRYTYDDHGRCVATTGSNQFLNGTIAYDPETLRTVETNSLGHSTTYHFNAAMQVHRVVNPLGHATVSEWDRYDRLLSRTDPLGRTTRYTYDQHGNLIAITRPDGNSTTTDYNELHLPARIAYPDGTVWRRTYDDRGNLTTVTDPTDATTTYTYDQQGCLTASTDALGQVRRVDCNAAGLPVAITDPLGAVTRYTRDSFGRVTVVVDPVGGVTRYEWTTEGKLAAHTRPDGATDSWVYDDEGNLIEHADALGQATRIEITHFDLPAARTTPDGARLEFSYDTELRLTSVTNPQGLRWRYDYDPAGNLIQETDFNNRVLTYAHDAAGQLVERTNGAEQTIRYTHDPLGNVTEQHCITEERGDTVRTFTYDTAGRMVRATNPDTELRLERDPLGRVLAETCNGRTITSSYDALGRRVHRRTPTGAQSTWEYNPNHQPAALHTAGRTLRFDHDPAGRETARHLDTGAVLAQTWDPNHQLRSQTLTATGSAPGQPGSDREARLVQHRTYDYRPDGYLTSIDDRLSGQRRFDLDVLGQITTVHSAGRTENYTYDLAGNLTHATWPALPHTDTVDAQGDREYAGTLIRRAGNVRFEHDAQGRVTLRQHKTPSAKPRTWHYTWDPEDRLTTVTTPDGHRWRYLYDPLGRRIAKQRLADDNATVVEQVDFTWDRTVLAEQTHTRSAGGRVTTTWDWEPGTFHLISQTERTPLSDFSPELDDAPQDWVDDQFYAIITDLIGTPTELVNSEGDIAWQPHTTLWGTIPTPGPGEADCPLRFPGQYFDDETLLHYNYFRYYDPTTGRYETNDPLGLAPSPNPHTYVPNPTNSLDPLGLAPYETFVRRGTSWESTGRLSKQAQAAEDTGRFPHGVSVTSPESNLRLSTNPEDAVTATRQKIDDSGFSVEHTPTRNDPDHHTLVLPKPVTSDVARTFNELFGRVR